MEYVCEYICPATLVLVDIAAEVVTRHTDYTGMKSQAQRCWEVHTSLRPPHVWLSFTFQCGPTSFLHPPISSSICSPQSPLRLSVFSSYSSFLPSSDFRGWCARLWAAVHPHHCREKGQRETCQAQERDGWLSVIFKSFLHSIFLKSHFSPPVDPVVSLSQPVLINCSHWTDGDGRQMLPFPTNPLNLLSLNWGVPWRFLRKAEAFQRGPPQYCGCVPSFTKYILVPR